MESFDIDVFFTGEMHIDASINGMHILTGKEGVPSPFDLFLVGIGTCSGARVLRFCQERNIPAENIHIKQRMFYNPDSHIIEKIQIDIQLPPDFPRYYQKAVIRAADACGVKRHLLNPPEFEIHTSFCREI